MRPSAPWTILHVDLDALPTRLEIPAEARGVLLYFRMQGMVLGLTHEMPEAFPMEAGDLARRAAQAIGGTVTLLLACGLDPVRPHELPDLWADRGVPAAEDLDRLSDLIRARRDAAPALTASIVICTRRRPRDLANCLDSLSTEIAGDRDIVVVDNGPDPETRAVVEAHPGVRYVTEPTPGLSRARNAGVLAARGDVVVFVDDDVRPEPGWIEPLLGAFAPGVDVVCGLVLPETLAAEAQIAFQYDLGFGGMGQVPLLYDRVFLDRSPASPPVWDIGAGANMAVRRRRVLELGGFDERIGPGAAGGCGDDSEYWSRVLHAGGAIVYEPLSVVRHRHRDSWDDLKRQAYGYGFGHIVALLAQYGRNRDRRDLRRALWTMPVWLARRGLKAPLQRLLRKPDRLTGPWLRGYAGSLAYLPMAFRPPATSFLPPQPRSDDE
ncbi:glycosyltransferase family 2 protein [Paracoccus sediminilitoris]|uniref:glycosyltransferase family 2 protein n=1 Tax=Paracoccus sediminilitoris TaxID=2202419 RepID=UPI000DB92AC4|nr:glycosyltransferase [Paracoccus sediminilitoris]